MIKILFVCHGNICRSPMAEYIMRDLVKDDPHFYIRSAATSTEEIGNSVRYGTKRILDRLGIDCSEKRAVQVRKADYAAYDYLIGMDDRNVINTKRICGGDPHEKITKLLDFTAQPRSISDPWYTGNFEETYRDVLEGCQALLQYIRTNQHL